MENNHDQTDIRVRVDTKVLQAIQQYLGKKSYRNITQASLTLLSWALEEAANNRIVVSTNKQNGEVRQLIIPELINPPAWAHTQLSPNDIVSIRVNQKFTQWALAALTGLTMLIAGVILSQARELDGIQEQLKQIQTTQSKILAIVQSGIVLKKNTP